jgi:hypothetical protein
MHRNSAGFIQLPLIAYGAIGAAVVIAGLGIACKVQTSRLEALRQEYESFKAKGEVLGQAAKKAAAEKEAADQRKKEETDALHRTAMDGLSSELRRLRNQRSPSGGLPKAPATSSRPDLAAFDRAELAAALRALDGDLQGIAGEGAAATIGLDAAKRWAQQR